MYRIAGERGRIDYDGVMQTLLPLAGTVAALLKDHKQTIAVAESSTGGLLSAALLAIPGASAYFLGGAVVYTKPARRLLMNLADRDVAAMRSASEPYALILARTARERFAADWGLSETGATGPTGNRYGDKAGHSCLAVVGPQGERAMTLETGRNDRAQNMRDFAAAALKLLAEELSR